MPDGSDFGTLRLFARSESTVSSTVMDFFAEWLGELGIDSEITVMESNKLTNVIIDGEYDVFEWGWYVEPDPDSMLSYLICDQRGGWNDSWCCNEEYDALYEQQNGENDDAARQDLVKQMQEIFYYDAPYLVTAYTSVAEAYRSDRCACFQPQPDPGGILLIQYGIRNYLEVRPGRRGRRLRRRRDRARGQRLVERRWRWGRRGRRLATPRSWSSAACCWPCSCWAAASWRCDGGRRRPTASDA